MGKAEVLRKGKDPIVTSIGDFVRPLIIRLLSYVRYHVKPAKLSRKRIYKRDGYACVYCGSEKHLTLDHVLPRSRGGRNTWDNLVACCSSCNHHKGNKTPDEAGMRFLVRPYTPGVFSDVLYSNVEDLWEDFKKAFV
jgi:5-methylcytosine-specific restriction endonuclease McrA